MINCACASIFCVCPREQMSGHQPSPCGQETGMTGQLGAEKLLCRKPGHTFPHTPFDIDYRLFGVLEGK